MRELILNKQPKGEAKKSASMKTLTQKVQIIAKPALVLIAILGFIVMSLKNNSLFLTELLLCGGILLLISLVHVISKFSEIDNTL